MLEFILIWPKYNREKPPSLFYLLSKEGFQIDSDKMALPVNEETTERASANHNAAWKKQFETSSKFNSTYLSQNIILY